MGGIWFEKTNALLNLIGHQRDIDKTYLYAQDAYGPKYKLLKNKHEVLRSFSSFYWILKWTAWYLNKYGRM